MTLHSRVSRYGLALLELLLTLAISAILLGAIASSILAHYQTTDAGERQIDEGRATYAWAQRLRRDLSTLATTPTSQALTTDANVEGGVRERVLIFGSNYSFDPIVLWGNQHLLVLAHMVPVSSPRSEQSPRLEYETIVWTSQPMNQWQIPIPDARQGIAFKQPGRALAGLQTLLTGQEQLTAPIRATVRLGEAIRILDQANFPFPAAILEFRYFDGLAWRESWNSGRSGQLPVAIEARLLNAPSQDDQRFVHHLQTPSTTRIQGQLQ